MIFHRVVTAFIAVTGSLFLSSCMTTQVSLDYEPRPGQVLPGPAIFGVGSFTNGRGEEAHLLGTVRTPMGTPIEHVQTSIPIETIVSNAFGHGLSARGMLASGAPNFVVTGEVMDLYCQQIVHPHGYAKIRVNAMNTSTGQIVFSKVFEGQRQSAAYRPGTGSPVPLLRTLTSRALQDAVDKALDDAEFRNRTGAIPSR